MALMQVLQGLSKPPLDGYERSAALRIWGSGLRISPGAPPSTHLRTRFTGGLPGKDGALKHVLAAFDADAVVVHLDDVNERLQVGLSERHRSGGELLTHTAAESLDERRVDADCRSNIELGGLKGSLRAVATGLEAVEPILEYIIEVCHAVLDQPAEPL